MTFRRLDVNTAPVGRGFQFSAREETHCTYLMMGPELSCGDANMIRVALDYEHHQICVSVSIDDLEPKTDMPSSQSIAAVSFTLDIRVEILQPSFGVGRVQGQG